MVFRDSVWVLEALGCLSSRNQPKAPLTASAALGDRASSPSGPETVVLRQWSWPAQGHQLLCGCGAQSQGLGLVPIASLGVFIPAESTSSGPQTQLFALPGYLPLFCCSQFLSFKETLPGCPSPEGSLWGELQEEGSCTWTRYCCSVAQSCPTLWTPWTARQASLFFTFYL